MRREEYLSELAAALAGMDRGLREEALREMEGHLDALLARPGAVEAEVVAGLTPPLIFAAALREELDVEAVKPGHGESSRGEGRFPSSFSLRDLFRAFAGGERHRRESRQEELDLGGASLLAIDLGSADIKIEEGRGPLLELDLVLEGNEGELSAATPLLKLSGARATLDEEGLAGTRVVELRLGIPSSVRGLELRCLSGDIEIEAPGRSVEANSKSGDISVDGAASLRADTLSGDIEAEGLSGHFWASTASGDIEAEGLPAGAEIQTSSGDVALREISGRVELRTSSGDVEIEAGPSFEGGSVSSSSGDIGVELRGVLLEIEAGSVSGEVEAPGNTREGRRSWVSGTGGGLPRLLLRSVSGDIDVED